MVFPIQILLVRPALDPSEIIYENSQYSYWRFGSDLILSYSVCGLLMAGSYYIIKVTVGVVSGLEPPPCLCSLNGSYFNPLGSG